MARQENLTVVKSGLNRLRTKGAALKDSLYELLNGYVTTQKTVVVRPGTILNKTLPTGTVGLVSFNGELNVFASANVENIPVGYKLNVLRAPNGEDLTRIHFAEPFLGALYVAAEFADGEIYHYWLQEASTWAADTVYEFNQLVEPTTPNSFVYRATRNGAANPTWSAGASRTVGDKVEPTVRNGFYFEVVQVVGTLARSGDTEPDWADVEPGELINENVDGTNIPNPATPPSPPRFDELPDSTRRRYTDERGRRP